MRGAPGSVTKCEEERAQWGGLEGDPSSVLCISSSPVYILHPSPFHLPRPLPSFLLSAESAIKGGPAGLQKPLKETSGQLQRLAGSDYTGATLKKQVGVGGGEGRGVTDCKGGEAGNERLAVDTLSLLPPDCPPLLSSGADP